MSIRSPVPIGPGLEIGGFEIESLIGRGGMSNVYRARQTRLQRSVALKVLLPVLAADEEFVQRFRREGVSSARLEHAHIVPVYEAGDDKGHMFIAMRLVEGVTLRDRLGDAGSALDVQESLAILTAVGEALDYAHGVGYVHRDVKPANVLLGFDGHVYLSDFGLTKLLGRDPLLTSTGHWVGTADYMAPEQARGTDVDHRADLYALGCVVFECITGTKPYGGDDAISVAFAHATGDIPQVSARNKSLDRRADEVMARALAKSPAERYEHAADLLAGLRAALERPARRTRCPKCRSDVVEREPSCAACGAVLAWCARCARATLPSDRFCMHCGAPRS